MQESNSYKVYTKIIHNYDNQVLERVSLIESLSRTSSVFPVMRIEINENTICQYTNHIPSFHWPEDQLKLKIVWNEFKHEVFKLHQAGYVHGDILFKNIVFDGCILRLIDHELSLRNGAQLRATYPWVNIDDLVQGNISQKTDIICIRATELRIFQKETYWQFRKEQQADLKSHFNKMINFKKYYTIPLPNGK